MTFKAPEVADDGVAIWHARTVPELADAVRWMAGKLSQVEAPTPPDLSDYVTTEELADYVLKADFDVLLADVAAQQAQITDLEGQVSTLQGEVVDLQTRVAALETPVP